MRPLRLCELEITARINSIVYGGQYSMAYFAATPIEAERNT